ncbi:Lrp/AsnC family transcriptional regulator [Burkholderia cenocepacia]
MAAITLDDLDLRILSILQDDASVSNLELAERALSSPPTCMRRVRRLTEAGVIRRQVAMLDQAAIGTAVTALIEVSLDRQTAEDYDAFEAYVCAEPSVTQCYRVSPGPDFVVVADLADVAEYDEFARRLFTGASNVRNVRTFFSTRRAKFETNARVAHAMRKRGG